jgi:uncharacterized membrane protein
MVMTAGLRKFALILHVVSSVGWIGSVAGFLALAVVGLSSAESRQVAAAYVGMDIVTRTVIVPLSFASLVTGVVQSLGTPWGLFRHYWVLFKLLLTVVATAVLMIHTQPIAVMAQAAADNSASLPELHRIRIQLVVDALAGIAVLLIATVLAVYKPRGVTRWGRRYANAQAKAANS